VLKESEMVTFEVKDMSCGHCVNTITKAVRSVDQGAKLEVDLAARRLQIEPTEADTQELTDAITEAGYTPVPVQHATTLTATPARRGGCCCG